MENIETKNARSSDDQKMVTQAIKAGQKVLSDGGSKADAARAIYEILIAEDRPTIIQAFIDGATVTEKAAPTYFYNIVRQFRKGIKPKAVQHPVKTKKEESAT